MLYLSSLSTNRNSNIYHLGTLQRLVRFPYGTDSGLYLLLLLLLIQKSNYGFPVEPHLSGGTEHSSHQPETNRWFQVLAVSQPSRRALPCCESTNRSVLLPLRASPSDSQQLYTREYTRRLSGKPMGRSKLKTATQVE